jgi:hypothetical protein
MKVKIMTEITFTFFKRYVLGLLISLITGLIILPFMTLSSKKIVSSISSGSEALGIFYYPRIFSLSESWLNIGDYFTESIENSVPTAEFVMLGDLFERILFKLLSEDIAMTYKIVSAIYLTIWIYILSQIVLTKGKRDFLKTNVLIAALLIVFFGNNSLFNENYGFNRLISPQISILIWILGIYCIHKYYQLGAKENNRSKYLISFAILILISSMTYLFTFLALICVSATFALHLFCIKRLNDLKFLILLLFMSLIPFATSTLINYNDMVFSQVLERMGLFESRLPGTVKTVALCLIVIILTYFYSKLIKIELNKNPFILTVIIFTSGLILASQSNLITNKTVQFYHFETYAYILLISVIAKISLQFNKNPRSNKVLKVKYKYMLTAGATVIVLLVFFQTNIRHDNPNELKQFFIKNFSESQNLIVDIDYLDYSIPIYTKSKVLYQGDIIAYKFSNTEIMKRYFVNTGCPNSISLESIPGFIDYRIQPLIQKGNQIYKYLSFVNLDRRFDNLYLSYFDEAQSRQILIESQINEFMTDNVMGDCIKLARQFGINYIVYDSKSNWVRNFPKGKFSEFKVNEKKILVAKITN